MLAAAVAVAWLLGLLLLLEPAGAKLLRAVGQPPRVGPAQVATDLLACGYSNLATALDSSSSSADKATILSVDRERYPFCYVLSTGQVALYWTHDGYGRQRQQAAGGDGGNITFVVVARTLSPWVALGLSRQGSSGMKGMDVALLRHEEGDPTTFRLEDRYSIDYTTPLLDERQDKTLLWARQHADQGVTSFAFTMPARSSSSCHRGDTEQQQQRQEEEDVDIAEDRFTNVMYAYGDQAAPPTEDKEEWFGYHGPSNRGSALLPLLLSDPLDLPRATGRVSPPTDAKVLDLVMRDVEVRPSDSRWCIWVEVPSDAKYHVYDYELVRDGGATRVLDQMQVSDCRLLKPPADQPLNQVFDCSSSSGVVVPMACPVVMGYSRNNGTTSPPPPLMARAGAAWPFGANISRYWLLEMQMGSPQGLTTASAGFRVTYSPTLRPHDMGVLATGSLPTAPTQNLTSNLIIPPGLPEYDFVDVCPSTCTEAFLPPSGVKILSAHLHMHSHGRAGAVEVIRANGSKVLVTGPTTYDSHTQPSSSELFTTPIDLLPGDHLVTTCIYNTTGRSTDLGWGQGEKEGETCSAYLYVYPALHSWSCLNLQGVKSPLAERLFSSNPGKSFAMCAKDGASTDVSGEAIVFTVPPEEQRWLKEGLGKARKVQELTASLSRIGQAQACGGS